jgi:drug/metabolite transporter (DMT)-like permease
MGEATVTVPFDYMRIVYAGIFGLLLFSEIPSWWSVAGAMLIVGSNLYLMRRG